MWKLTVLTIVWTVVVVYAVWFGVQVWTSPGLMMYVGHSLSLIFWGIPVLPVLLLSWWLLSRWTGRRQRIPPIVFFGGIALILTPTPPSPMSHTVFTKGASTTEVTTVSPWFWLMMVLVSLGPAVLTTAMWYSTIRARRLVTRREP